MTDGMKENERLREILEENRGTNERRGQSGGWERNGDSAECKSATPPPPSDRTMATFALTLKQRLAQPALSCYYDGYARIPFALVGIQEILQLALFDS